ncbi:hypothetical protein B5F12_02360 [Pseudoflavonifractor sp. An176]|nr:hypothetical protein B5F12_02360 [Pseudoflavonifractor sp. An176]
MAGPFDDSGDAERICIAFFLVTISDFFLHTPAPRGIICPFGTSLRRGVPFFPPGIPLNTERIDTMSASREKKQRQTVAPSDKNSKAYSEQAAYKRKVRTYTAIGVVVAILVAALITWNSGFFQRRATAATIGDTKVSVSELGYYYYNIRYMYAYYYRAVDPNTPDNEQMYDEEEGKTYRDFFLESALSQAQNDKALYDAAVEAGYSKSDIQEDLDERIDSTKSAAKTSAVSYKAYIQSMYGQYITPSVYEDLEARSLLATKYYNDVYTDTKESFTETDLEDYYNEHKDDADTFKYSYLYFKADEVEETDDEGNTLSNDEISKLKEEAMAAAKTKADEALAAYQEGTDVAKLISETSPSNSADHTTVVGASSLSSIYKDKLLELEKDQGAVVENTDAGYYVVIFHDRYQDKTTPATIRDILIKAETTTDEDGNTVAPTQEAWDAAKAKAEEVMAKWEESDKTAEAFGKLAEEYSASSTASNGGVTTGVKSGTLNDDRNSWLFEEERATGDVTMVQHQDNPSSTSAYFGYHITYFQEWEEESWKQTVRSALTTDAMTDWSDELLGSDTYATALADGAKYFGY